MPRRGLTVAFLALPALLLPVACSGAGGPQSGTDVAAVAEVVGHSTSWEDGADAVPSGTLLTGLVELTEPADEVRIALDNARTVRIPDTCTPSTVTATSSAIVDADLVCAVAPGDDTVLFTVIALGDAGEAVGGQVVVRRGTQSEESDLPTRAIAAGGESTLTPDVRLLSSPDFLNGDVGALADGPGFWADMRPRRRTPNSINRAYEVALDRILDDWQSLDPAGVLVAGDLTNGRWGYDDTDSGNFGPVDTLVQKRRALRRAARTYYPQWRQRFVDHDLSVFPAMGDHEYGDDPWPRRKRRLATAFKAEFASVFTTDRAGRPLFDDHPRGKARLTAYAGRPSPDVQVVTLDVFDITPEQARIGVDRRQLVWLRDVLSRARRDGVEWIIVQAHTPILGPVRARASSGLRYPGGSDSRLWQVFKRFGVDLYLTGEVHDTTVTEADGIVQVAHGGIFQFSLTTALLLDVYDDRLYVTLRDYDMQHSDGPNGTRLWETRRGGMPTRLRVSPEVSTIGTATILGDDLEAERRLSGASGILVPTENTD